MKLVAIFGLSLAMNVLGAWATDVKAATVQITGGYAHYCALSDTNQVHCWGWNFYGQSGADSEYETLPKPNRIDLPEGRVEKIAGGGSTSCAIVDTRLYCWGKNDMGQLGTGDREHRHIPTLIDLPGRATDVSLGQNYICAVVDRGVMCWGWNYSCQIGQRGCEGGTDNPRKVISEPHWVADLGPGSGVEDLHASYSHNCVLKDGGAYCWGSSLYGKLGDGIRRVEPQPTPKQVIGLGPGSGVTDIAGFEYGTCAISRGRVYCWGKNAYIGSSGDRRNVTTEPIRMRHLKGSNWLQVESGGGHLCAQNADDNLLCWGNGAMGALGNGEEAFFAVPQVPLLSDVAHTFELGDSSSCAAVGKRTYCWGWNAFCQGGTGQCNFSNLKPLPVKNL